MLTENELLGALISCADEKHECNTMTAINKTGYSDIDCLPYLQSLEDKGYIKKLDLETTHIYPAGYNAHKSKFKITMLSIKNALGKSFKWVIGIIAGIIIAVVAAVIIHFCGWN